MNALVTCYKKTILSALVVSMLSFGTVVLAREGADAARDTIRKALIAAKQHQRAIKRNVDSQERCGCNKPKPKGEEVNSDQQDRCGVCGKPKPKGAGVDAGNDQERCGCNKPKPKGEDNAQDRCAICGKPKPKGAGVDAGNDQERCGCNKPKPKGEELNSDQQDRCGCSKPKPKSQERCSECQEAAIKQSIADVLAEALAEVEAIAKRMGLDTTDLRKWARAPREELPNPSNSCENPVEEVGCPPEQTSCCDAASCIICSLQCQCQGCDARECCRKIKHGIGRH